jgi:hypothetical protein
MKAVVRNPAPYTFPIMFDPGNPDPDKTNTNAEKYGETLDYVPAEGGGPKAASSLLKNAMKTLKKGRTGRTFRQQRGLINKIRGKTISA